LALVVREKVEVASEGTQVQALCFPLLLPLAAVVAEVVFPEQTKELVRRVAPVEGAVDKIQ